MSGLRSGLSVVKKWSLALILIALYALTKNDYRRLLGAPTVVFGTVGILKTRLTPSFAASLRTREVVFRPVKVAERNQVGQPLSTGQMYRSLSDTASPSRSPPASYWIPASALSPLYVSSLTHINTSHSVDADVVRYIIECVSLMGNRSLAPVRNRDRAMRVLLLQMPVVALQRPWGNHIGTRNPYRQARQTRRVPSADPIKQHWIYFIRDGKQRVYWRSVAGRYVG